MKMLRKIRGTYIWRTCTDHYRWQISGRWRLEE